MGIAAALGGSAVLSAGTSLAGSSEQASAANSATNAQLSMFNKTQQNLQPYMNLGQGASTNLTNLTGTGLDSSGNPTGNPLTSPLLSPITMDETTLQQTPGYQFNLQQGLKATQNSAAARGLGGSGAALKGAATYATGLADSTYQNQFNNALTNQNNQFNRLMSLSGIGENAAAGLGNNATATGQGIANSTIAGGTAQAAGLVGAGNAGQTAANGYLLNNLLTNNGANSTNQIQAGLNNAFPDTGGFVPQILPF